MSNFKTWEEVRKNLNITPEQEEEIRIESEIISATVEARKKQKITQAEISKKSGLTQSVVARVESGTHSPTMQTLIKYLHAIGYTLKVVPANKKTNVLKKKGHYVYLFKTGKKTLRNDIHPDTAFYSTW